MRILTQVEYLGETSVHALNSLEVIASDWRRTNVLSVCAGWGVAFGMRA
jgi:hypothetical protein